MIDPVLPILSDVVDVYNYSTNTWTSATLSVARASLSAVAVGDRVLFAGGLGYEPVNGFFQTDVIDVLDASTLAWGPSIQMSIPRNSLAGGSAGDLAVFAGGSGPGDVVALADAYFSAGTTPYNGTGINLDMLTATEVVIGTNWTVTLAPQATRGAGSWIVFLRSADSMGLVLDLGNLFALPPAGMSELLVDPLAFMANFIPPQHGGAGSMAMFSAAVPPNCALVGHPWFAQAIVTGDLPGSAGGVFDPWFSSAVGGVIGTF